MHAEGFIGRVAENLYERYGDDISSLHVLFPSRRARLFFNDALSRIAKKPLWSPRFTTIDELMQQIAGIAPADPVRLAAELYKVYGAHHDETFDAFYFWGEMLLADFDSVDKYRIDADMLFRNIADLKTLESDLSYLSSEQIALISRFWNSFGTGPGFSAEQEKFVRIWRSLAPVYHAFRGRLEELGIGYTGMIHRRAADRIEAGEAALPEGRRYVAAGFNALSKCEKILFDHLQATAEIDFFWDYDRYYVDDPRQEAGLFLRENLLRYPESQPDPAGNEAFVRPKEITVVAAPSDSLQAKYVYDFLEEVGREQGRAPGKETAVVLTDESLLEPVLYSIPESVGEINITMGYPLRRTLAYSFVERLIELQSRKRRRGKDTLFYHSDVSGLLSHPYAAERMPEEADALGQEVVRLQQVYVDAGRLRVGGVIERIFTPAEEWTALQEYLLDVLTEVMRTNPEDAKSPSGDTDETAFRREYFSLIAEQLHKLRNSIEEGGIEVSMPVFASLLRRMLQSMTVPYEGEPLQGIQIMGILETRNLDFENVVILSANDDTFPGNRAAGSSFIPYNLRLAYGLPTPAHHEGVYAYYFYRLLQRARRVHLVYCSRSDDKRTGEPSRYIYQLRYESKHALRERRIGLDVNLAPPEPVAVEKTGDTARQLEEFLVPAATPEAGTNPAPEGAVLPLRSISPTAFFRYVECPLKFYFYSVARIRPEEEVVEEVDLPLFGTILHRAMELLYRGMIGVPQPGERIAELIRSPQVAEAVDRAIRDEYVKDDRVRPEDYGGNLTLIRDIVIHYINTCLLPYDAAHAGFETLDLERALGAAFPFDLPASAEPTPGRNAAVRFTGLADRIDRLPGGTLRVVDYKTGAPRTEFRGVDALFSGKERERNPAALQTFLYGMMLDRSEGADVQPALYYVRAMNDPDYSPLLIDRETGVLVEHYSDYKEAFEGRVADLLREIFDPTVPFLPCEEPALCERCDYREICRR